MAGLAGLGGVNTPRPDQAWRPGPGTTIAPGGAAGVFRGRLVIVYGTGPGSGVFVYDPSPGAGNLVASITEASTDPFGNATIPGAIASYVKNVGIWFASTLNGANLEFYAGGALPSDPYTSTAFVGAGGDGGLVQWNLAADATFDWNFGAGTIPLFLTATAVQAGPTTGAEMWITASQIRVGPGTALVATEPGTTTTPETWHPLTLASGWSAVSGFPTPGYRLNALGNVELTGRITHASLASRGLIARLPAGYYSTYQRGCPVSLVAGSPAASGLPRLYCSTSGQLNIESLSSTARTVTLDLDGSTFHLSSG